MGPHPVDYKKLPLYKDLINMGLKEITGPRQAKTGTIYFSSQQVAHELYSGEKIYYEYKILSTGKVTRLLHSGNQMLVTIPKVEERSVEDYNKAFQSIKDKLEGKKRKSTPWMEQVEQSQTKLIESVFYKNDDWNSKAFFDALAHPEDYTVNSDDGRDFEKYYNKGFLRYVHFCAKRFGVIKKGRDYQ
jgi:hypothetical protein